MNNTLDQRKRGLEMSSHRSGREGKIEAFIHSEQHGTTQRNEDQQTMTEVGWTRVCAPGAWFLLQCERPVCHSCLLCPPLLRPFQTSNPESTTASDTVLSAERKQMERKKQRKGKETTKDPKKKKEGEEERLKRIEGPTIKMARA